MERTQLALLHKALRGLKPTYLCYIAKTPTSPNSMLTRRAEAVLAVLAYLKSVTSSLNASSLTVAW